MRIEEFNQQVKRLSDTYGAQHFKQERLTLLWRRISNFSASWLERTVDGLIAHHRQAPMPSDFEEAINAERERSWRNEKSESLEVWNGPVKCDSCKDTGVYLCSHPSKGGLWAFRCDCPRGYSDPRKAIPQFKQAHADEGYLWRDMPVYRKAGA